MKVYYDKDISMIEVFFEKTENYADEIDENIVVFKADNDDRVVGYGFDNAFETAFENDLLTSKQKLAILLKMTRIELGLTQKELAQKLGCMQLRQYQRLESGKDNTTLDTIDEKVKRNLPNVDLSRIFKTGKAS